MNFLALMLGLAVERLLTHLFHLREFHWLDPLFDKIFHRAARLGRVGAALTLLLLVLLLVLPVIAVSLALSDYLVYVPGFIFAVVVLLFCLGPRDLVEEVDDYRTAIARDDHAEIAALAKELLEQKPEEDDVVPDIETAVYAQANNRIFAVVFWFILLGAAGAWLFRVLDLIRRRAIRHTGLIEFSEAPEYVQMIIRVHALLAWAPARLLMLGYTLAGSYENAVQAWRAYQVPADRVFPRDADTLLGAVGQGAASRSEPGSISERARIALELVTRTLWMIWCPALALLTLYDWII
jgi:membrane protein required for beta-lactamase induction